MPKYSSSNQRGGMTILLALVLLSIMSVAALGIANTSLRELTTTGTVLQGNKAAEAADAGLDWAIVWSDEQNRASVLGSTKAAGLFTNALNAALADSGEVPVLSSGNSWIGQQSDRAIRVTSLAGNAGTSGMVFNTSDALVAQGKSGGNQVIQKFDMDVRYIGEKPPDATTGGDQASGGTDTSAKSQSERTFLISSNGSANVDLGDGTYVTYRQRRDLITQLPPSQKQQ